MNIIVPQSNLFIYYDRKNAKLIRRHEICCVIYSENKVNLILTNSKIIPIQTSFESFKTHFLNHNFLNIRSNLIVNPETISAIQDETYYLKIKTNKNFTIMIDKKNEVKMLL
jgi:DNA-binding LytR/AlgR family response regulator